MTGLILCGGEGKRLAGIIPTGLPKCAVSIGGLPVWQYVELAALAGGCSRVDLAPGPYKAHFMSHGFQAHWVIEGNERAGTGGAIQTCVDRPLAVFNGDTLLFGEFKVPPADGITAVLGRNRVTGRSGESVFRVIGPRAVLIGVRNMEDLKTSIVVDLSSSLSFIDIGTPAGLAFALTEARKWS